ncbi:MAG: hypothetical protein R3C05_16975 [Pirellulaceae bacterium]
MSNLNPQTSAKLLEFGRRQKRLLFVRAVCVGIVSLLLLMSLVALIDWLWILSDRLRVVLSVSVYAVVFALVWWTSLRRWFSPRDPESLAAGIEEAEPQLREQLLAAVELSDERAQGNGSQQFRQMLQDKVAASTQWVDVRKLLPVRLIGRWLVGAIAIACLFGILISLPGLSFRQLITRAMIPGANVDRVSKVQVVVLQPSPASQTVPRGETVGIVVQLTGPEVNEVTLESYCESTGLSEQMMRAQGERRFAANITVRDEQVEYRILAGDAITRRYTLRSRPRPRVEAFQKTYIYPQYTKLEPETISETHGDLVALEGTQVELLLGTDQAVSEAQLLIETSGSDRILTIDAVRREDGFLSVSIPIRQASVYKVHLKSAETGFDNTFSPRYEIRPEPDLVPRVGFLKQEETTLLRPANDILSLMAMAQDDLPLDTLRQETSVNGGRWQRRELQIEPSSRITEQWEFDLLPLKLKSGDTVQTKMVAIDRKGQRGESVPLKIVITSDDFDPSRHDSLIVKAFIADALEKFAASITEATDGAEQIFERNKTARVLPAEDQVALNDVAEKVAHQSGEAVEVIRTLMPKMPAGLDSYEAELALRMLSQLQRDLTRELKSFAEAYDRLENDGKIKGDAYNHFRHRFKQAGENARWLDERFRDFVSHDLAAGISTDLHGLREQQKLIVKAASPVSETRLRRHQEVAMNYIHALEDLMRKHGPRIRRQSENGLRSMQEWLGRYRAELQLGLDNADTDEPLRRLTEQFYNELDGRLNQSMFDGQLPEQIGNSRRDLARRSGVIADSIDLAIRASERLVEARVESIKAKESSQIEQAQEQIRQRQAEFDWRLASAREQLADRLEANQLRTDRLPIAVADASLASRAIDHVVKGFKAADDNEMAKAAVEQMRTIRDAFRELEAGHSLFSKQSVAAKLLANERWQSQDFRAARIESPRLWDGIYKEMEVAAERATSAKYPGEVVNAINELRWGDPLNKAANLILMRRWDRNTVSAATSIDSLVSRFDALHSQVDPLMAAARKRIADLIPSIPELAKDLAEQARELQQQTEELAGESTDEQAKEESTETQADAADAAAEDENASEPEGHPEQTLESLQELQADLAEQLQALLDALAEDASQQDLMEDEGRERARDADDSIAMIEEPAEKAAEDLSAAEQATSPEQQASKLEEAAKNQEQLANALEQVAEHFEKLDAGEDVAESRQQLRQAEAELEEGRRIAQDYAKLEKLNELNEQAQSDQQKLLQQLERELKKNPQMQEALSSISAEAAAQALQKLEHSQRREDDLQRSLERSDPAVKAEKQKLQQDMREIAQKPTPSQTDWRSKQSSRRTRLSNPKRPSKPIRRQELQKAAAMANQVNEQQPLQEMKQGCG